MLLPALLVLTTDDDWRRHNWPVPLPIETGEPRWFWCGFGDELLLLLLLLLLLMLMLLFPLLLVAVGVFVVLAMVASRAFRVSVRPIV